MSFKKLIISSITLLMLLSVAMAPVYAETSISDISLVSVNLVNQDPTPAVGGDIFEVRIGVKNEGGKSAGDYILELDPSYPFQKVAGEELSKEIGFLDKYQDDDKEVIITAFKLRVNEEVTSGNYPLKVLLYKKGDLTKTGYKTELTIDVGNKENAEVMLSTSELNPGENSKLTFTIKNAGSAPLKDLTFSWDTPENKILPLGSGNTRFVKYIGVNQAVNLDYDVMAGSDIAPGLYKINMYLNYEDTINSSEKNVIQDAGIHILEKADFEIAFSENLDDSYTFSIMNVGNSDTKSVSMYIPKQDGWTIIGSNNAIIGNLDAGDYTYASFKLLADSSNQSEISIKVEAYYTSNEGNRKIVEKEILVSNSNAALTYITQADSEKGGFTGYIIMAGIVIIAILILGIFIIRKILKKIKSAKKE
ncbi:COG1361 S-layer family protein [Methanococcus maripaludis]|uniref:NPCBM-associated, NEW3 domain of alpha-galactosidase n=1 Tax=Methanococcus maripaludis TaxID=39152 RepID=A0A8T4H4X9_METMI|nr:COG1361 S-layer family protein [Methanococcus maripaludis]MBP2219014.1 hypothetical protein [Methanococcus maripaludis]